MSQPRADDTSVRFSSDLSNGEKEATAKRKAKVLECLRSLDISGSEETMPNIAVLGSGGGLRATIALLGTLVEMKNQGLLDAVMYLCGVSGSTWCMSTLYNEKDWAQTIETQEKTLCDHLCQDSIDIEKDLDLATKAADDVLFSLTDVWEAFVVNSVLKLYSETKLSEHKAASSSGINPYPIYAAIENNTFEKKNTSPGTWFEFTPDESGFPGLGAFVSTEDLGSKFQGGNLTGQEEEKNIDYLQGLWGSALGNMGENILFLIEYFLELIQGKKEGKKSLDFAAVMKNISSHLASFENSQPDYWTIFEKYIGKIILSIFDMEVKDPGFFLRFCKFCSKFKNCLEDWRWGCTNNFLWENGQIHTKDVDKLEILNLIDAGVAINSAYPLVLRPARRVGLILSFDFSEGDPFETLKKASKYCEDNQIPFPPIDPKVIENKDNPSNCYIFSGTDTPTVMHFPLFNTKNCPEPQEIEKSREKFGTFNMYYAKNDVDELLSKAGMNVSNNKEKILEQIQKIVSATPKRF